MERWELAICASRHAELDTIVVGSTEIPRDYAYWERQALIEALEHWLAYGELRAHNYWTGSKDGWDSWG